MTRNINDTLDRLSGGTATVTTLIGDMAYSDGDVRHDVQDAGAKLVAKVPEVYNGGRFTKHDFVIDPDASTVTCPAGHTTTTFHGCKDHKGRPPVPVRR